MTTPNLGLYIPDNTEIARLWADEDETPPDGDWLRANNTIVEDAIGDLALLTWEPKIFTSLTGSTESSLGTNGTSSGQYRVLPNDIVIGWGKFDLGTDPFPGSDIFLTCSLPAGVSSSFFGSTTLGAGYLLGEVAFRDASSVATNSQTGVVQLVHSSSARIRFAIEQGSFGEYAQNNGAPFTFAVGDAISFNFIYLGA